MQYLNTENATIRQPLSKSVYDLAIVGSGISCTYTLIHYINLLKEKFNRQQLPKEPIKVVILDKYGEFWTGIPYGSRTGQQSLIITALKEFLPQQERDRFIGWLNDNCDSVLDSLSARGGILNRQWLKLYQSAMVEGNWDELFLPRYVFGWYLTEQVEQAIQQARSEGYLQCDLVIAEVVNIQQVKGNYQVDFTVGDGDNSCIRTEKVVLAIGSPPNKATVDGFEKASANVCAIANMYEPSQNENIQRIAKFLSKSDTPDLNRVLIIGSNASALETLYSLNNLPEAEDLISKFIIVSPNARFPHRIYNEPASTSYIPQNLKTLIRSKFTAEQIYEAVKKDVEAALKQNETVDGTYKVISKEVINALNMLDFDEQKMFVIKYGVEIGKYQRRAGQDYLNVVDRLILEDRLEFIKGKFSQTIPLSEGKLGFEYVTGDRQQLFTDSINIIINCAGFQDLTKSDSILIKNLVERGICTPNDSKCGFEMSGDFEVNKNFYLMGPLVAGNINDKLKIWHAESCGRIINLSRKLAEIL